MKDSKNDLCNILEANDTINWADDLSEDNINNLFDNNVKMAINGIDIKDNKSILKLISENNNDSKILIENMEEEFRNYSKKIKKNINNDIKNDNIKIVLINNLNEILSMINLLKSNYEDAN
jgi:hypothetical protein